MQGVEILQALFDSEIHASVGWCWDGGVDWALHDGRGQPLNGRSGCAETVAEACVALARAAVREFPQSDFAARWGGA
jgi:hypothetical protein